MQITREFREPATITRSLAPEAAVQLVGKSAGPQIIYLSGHQGIDGKSAYQVALEQGFSGTEQEWLSSLQGSGSIEFTQAVPLSVWTIPHNLGRRPDVTLYDSNNEQMFADVHHDNLNQVTITFSEPVSGFARID